MRSTFPAEVLDSGAIGQRVRVSVKDAGGTFRDLTTYPGYNLLDSADWQDDIDSPHATASIVLKRDVEGISLAPLMALSPLNHGFDQDAAYGALLAVAREIKIEAATNGADYGAGTWETFFHGYIDVIDPGPSESITLECRDLGAKLMDTFIEVERVYGITTYGGAPVGVRLWKPNTAYVSGEFIMPTDGRRAASPYVYEVTTGGTSGTTEPTTWPSSGTVATGTATLTYRSGVNDSGHSVESVMQRIITDNGLSVTMYTPTSPSWNIRAFIQQRESVFDAIRTLAMQIGWDVRYKWRSGTAQFELTFYVPDRATTSALRTFGADDYEDISRLATDVSGIRNAVRVVYPDRSDRWPDGTPKRKIIDVTDSTSITAYGRRFMEIVEDDMSNIDSSTEATTLANAALSDLKDPKAEQDVELVYGFPWAELGDLYAFSPNGRHYSTEQKWAVYGVSHSASEGKIRTTLSTRGSPAVGYDRWHEMEVRPSLNREAHMLDLFQMPLGLTLAAAATVGGTLLTIGGDPAMRARTEEHEIHISETSGFTPSSSTLKALTTGKQLTLSDLVPGKTYYAKAVPRFRNASEVARGEGSTELSFGAGRAFAGHYSPEVSQGLYPLNGGFEHAFSPISNTPPDHWTVNGGSWGSQVTYGTDGDGGRSMVLDSVAGSASVISAIFPIVGSWYNIEGVYKTSGANGGGVSFQVVVYFWKDAAGTPSATLASTTHTITTASLGTWLSFNSMLRESAPSDANFASVELKKSASASDYKIEVGKIWYSRMDVKQESATALSYTSPWTDYDGGSTFETGAYYRANDGRVWLRGVIKRGSGTPTAGEVIATLPTGYRPTRRIIYTVTTDTGAVRLDINTSGQLLYQSGGYGFMTLEGLSFLP